MSRNEKRGPGVTFNGVLLFFCMGCTRTCMCLCTPAHVRLHAVFVHLSPWACLWVAGQVMAGWNYGSGLSHPHFPLYVLQCQVVSSICWEVWLVVGFLSRDGLGECCAVHFFCRSGAYTMQWLGMCWADMSPACICYMLCYRSGHSGFWGWHVCESQDDFEHCLNSDTFPQKYHMAYWSADHICALDALVKP